MGKKRMEIHYSQHIHTNHNPWAFQENWYVSYEIFSVLIQTYPEDSKLQSSEQVTTLERVLLILGKGINNGRNRMIIGTGPNNWKYYPAQFCAYPNFQLKIISSLEQLNQLLTQELCLYRIFPFVLQGRHSLVFKNKT